MRTEPRTALIQRFGRFPAVAAALLCGVFWGGTGPGLAADRALASGVGTGDADAREERPGDGTGVGGDRGREGAERSLEAADEALQRGNLAGACAGWVSLLDREDSLAEEAAERLESRLDRCPLSAGVPLVVQAAMRASENPRHVFRLHSLASRLGVRYRDAKAAGMLPLRVEPVAGRTARSTAPVQAALSGVPVQPPTEPPSPAFVGALQTLRFCLNVEREQAVHLRLALPNPASVWLGGEVFAVRDASTTGTDPDLYRTLRLAPGTHCLDVVQAVRVPGQPMLHVLPRDPGSAADGARPTGGPEAPAGAGSRDAPPSSGSPRASQVVDASSAQGVESEAPSGPAAPDDCLALLDEVRQHLENGEEQAAEMRLQEVAGDCLSTADGLLVQVELLQARQWAPLVDELLDEAFRRYPEDCDVIGRWVNRRLERGEIPSPDSLAVVCEDVERLLRPLAISGPPADPLEGLQDAGRTLRYKLLPLLIAEGDVRVEEALDRLARSDLQLGWLMTDWWLARGESDRARAMADALSIHPGTTAGVRAQVGRLFNWGRSRPEWSDPERVVRSYLESGFAQGMPQVIVLDEGVVVPSPNGWYTLVQTTLTHVVSPDAAESIGEVSLAPDEELLALAVRKADGTWNGPEELGQSSAGKDTISLPGLVPGDFVLKRTVRELQADSVGGCHRFPPFYFGHRDLPIFLGRYVVSNPGSGLEYRVRGEVEVAEATTGRWEFVGRSIEPAPAEPWCPDLEAGVALVEVASPCLDWNGLRDGLGDRVVELCDVPSPFAGLEPAEIYEKVLAVIRIDPEAGVFSQPYSEILAGGSGNPVLALYCSLAQAGIDAHLVAVSSAAAPPLDLARPLLSPFDGTVVYVAGREAAWFDPYDPLSAPGRVRRSYAGRPGLVLTSRYPRLFVSLPQAAALDAWKIRVEAEIDGDGAVAGHLEIEGRGQAAAELRRQADGPAEGRERLASGVVGQVMPGVHVEASKFSVRGRTAQLSADFGRGPGAEERFLLLLPPIPARELSQLPFRTTPLFFPGFYNIDLDVEMKTEAGRFVVAAGTQKVETTFGSIELKVENGGDVLRVKKRASAAPARVAPDGYSNLVQFLSAARRMAGIAVEVAGESRDD